MRDWSVMVWGGGQQGGGSGKGPWGGGSGGGGPKNPWGRGNGSPKPPPGGPDKVRAWAEDLVRRVGGPSGGSGRFALIALAVVVFLWLLTGIYFVQPNEQGVVLRFGAYARTTDPGLRYHWPLPIESVLKARVTYVNHTDVGMGGDRRDGAAERADEALMLTGDENIVDINLSVFWVIKDARAYLFNIRQPDLTVKSAAESAIREIIGRTPIANALAEGRQKVETDTLTLLQSILDSYDAGISITQVQLQRVDPPSQVIEAFRDVQRARADQERARNEAEAYRNDVVPRAHGEAAQIEQEAEAYKAQVLNKAQGDAARFESVLNAYRAAKDVTAERLYLETMEQVLKNASKVVIDKNAGAVPYLPLAPAALREAPKGAAP